MIRLIGLTVLALGTFLSVRSQEDTVVLTYTAFRQQVSQHHPVAKQAQLQQLYGEASLLNARGGFDPKVFADISQKYFDGDQYYHLGGGGLSVPTWFGLEITGGYEQNQGVYLNPEDNTPRAGLWYLGLSVPLGQGLLVDERRTQLRQAQVFGEITQAQQELLLNKLQLESGKVYWDWFTSYHTLQVYQEALTLAQIRYEGVKQSARLGDRPSIDTVEAGIQVQNRMLVYQQGLLNWNNSTALLEAYLWAEGVVPLEVAPNTVPSPFDLEALIQPDSSFLLMQDSLLAQHPALRKSQLQVNQLEIEQRWKKEQLKPDIQLKYNPIAEANSAGIAETYSVANYTWGLSFSMPLFLRKERGAVQLAELKIQEAELKLSNQNAQLAYQVSASINEWSTRRQQSELYAQNVSDYAALLDGERQLFQSGESSLFMVNAREVGYIGAQIKWIEVSAKSQKAALQTQFALGVLNAN